MTLDSGLWTLDFGLVHIEEELDLARQPVALRRPGPARPAGRGPGRPLGVHGRFGDNVEPGRVQEEKPNTRRAMAPMRAFERFALHHRPVKPGVVVKRGHRQAYHPAAGV